MGNLSDPQITRDIKGAARLLAMEGRPVNPFIEAALQAYIEAKRHPDSLVRITVKDDFDTILVFEYLQRMDAPAGFIDWSKSSRRIVEPDKKDRPLLLLEFKNGSAIEVRGK